MKKRLLFLTLNTFSATGGIEKVCRIAGKALHGITAAEGDNFAVFSMHDRGEDFEDNYFPASIFRGFTGKRLTFVMASLQSGRGADTVILSHINLLSVGYLIKKISPKTTLILIAHGIEVWRPLTSLKMQMLKTVDLFLPVSNYTSSKLQTALQIPLNKLHVLNNCLDPFLKKILDEAKEVTIKEKYGIDTDDVVLFAISRLKFSEQYKGYDKVIEALTLLKQTIPNIKYLIVGRYEKEEKARLDRIVEQHDLKSYVIFTGFVADEDLEAHFNIADIYIMPSTGEGFGIVFIEALFYGKPVIAGNQDGSVDALNNGEFGLLVNPNKQEEIVAAVLKIFRNKEQFIPNKQKLIERFGFDQYKSKWHTILYPNKNLRKNSNGKLFVVSNK